jgi:hypothetical protein
VNINKNQGLGCSSIVDHFPTCARLWVQSGATKSKNQQSLCNNQWRGNESGSRDSFIHPIIRTKYLKVSIMITVIHETLVCPQKFTF